MTINSTPVVKINYVRSNVCPDKFDVEYEENCGIMNKINLSMIYENSDTVSLTKDGKEVEGLFVPENFITLSDSSIGVNRKKLDHFNFDRINKIDLEKINPAVLSEVKYGDYIPLYYFGSFYGTVRLLFSGLDYEGNENTDYVAVYYYSLNKILIYNRKASMSNPVVAINSDKYFTYCEFPATGNVIIYTRDDLSDPTFKVTYDNVLGNEKAIDIIRRRTLSYTTNNTSVMIGYFNDSAISQCIGSVDICDFATEQKGDQIVSTSNYRLPIIKTYEFGVILDKFKIVDTMYRNLTDDKITKFTREIYRVV